MDQALETIAAMRRQEDSCYSCSVYAYPTIPHGNVPDIDCRHKMAAWCGQVVDVCQLGRDTAEMSMNVLDRYLATPLGTQARMSRSAYRLACMASLYSCIKSVESQALHAQTFSDLSHGAYTSSDIKAEELRILQSLDWKVNPPTALAFVREIRKFHFVLPTDPIDRRDLFDLTELQAERAMETVMTSASIVAYAAFINALAIIVPGDTEYINYASHTIAEALRVRFNCDEYLDTQTALLRYLPKQAVHMACNGHVEDPALTVKHNSKANSVAPRPAWSPRSVSINSKVERV